ncbi:hypothetical protein FI667_g14261, partial [Globisporangium splendens]
MSASSGVLLGMMPAESLVQTNSQHEFVKSLRGQQKDGSLSKNFTQCTLSSACDPHDVTISEAAEALVLKYIEARQIVRQQQRLFEIREHSHQRRMMRRAVATPCVKYRERERDLNDGTATNLNDN